jgi:hypothetical protein
MAGDDDLRLAWRELHHTEPPVGLSRDLINDTCRSGLRTDCSRNHSSTGRLMLES